MTDQQRGDAMSCAGHPVLLTPQMDELADGGVRFEHAYSTCPVCIPARRSFMSGQFPNTHGVRAYRDGQEWDPAATLPGELLKAGYQTGIVGRNMHLHPLRKPYGFEHMAIAAGVREPAEYEQFMAENQPPCGGGYYGSGVMHNDWTARPWHLAEPLHQTNWTVDQALKFLHERDRSRPYFLVVSFVAPHPPLIPPAFYFERYLRQPLLEPAIGDWETPLAPKRPTKVDDSYINLTGELRRCMLAGYFGLINHIDDQIRRLLNPVTGFFTPDTVVVYTSDHGEMLGDHYRFRKSLPYEGSARVPLLVRGGRDTAIAGGQVRDQAVCLEDIMPTCLELAGLEIPPSVDGRSLVPLLDKNAAATNPTTAAGGWRPFVHGEYAHSHHYLTDGQWKYIWWSQDGTEQLFNLTDDPHECRELARRPEHHEQLQRWRTTLARHLQPRAEGCSDGQRLIAGRPHPLLTPTALTS